MNTAIPNAKSAIPLNFSWRCHVRHAANSNEKQIMIGNASFTNDAPILTNAECLDATANPLFVCMDAWLASLRLVPAKVRASEKGRPPCFHPVPPSVQKTAIAAMNTLPGSSSTDPSTQTVYIKNWGCSHANSDGEVMAGLLATQGYNVLLGDSADSVELSHKADVWVLNSCTVKNPSEQTFANEIAKAHKLGKKLVVAGCVPQASPDDKRWSNISTVGVQQIDQIVNVVDETLSGNVVRFMKDKKQPNEYLNAPANDNDDPLPDLEITPDSLTYDIPLRSKRKMGGAALSLPKIRRNPFVEIVPINTGCLNTCTYCKTRHARGDLGSYSPEEITDRIRQVITTEGVKEIWLTSEDLGAYGHDIGIPVSLLLKRIVQTIDECGNPEVMLRLGMTNPPYILKHAVAVSDVLNHPQVYAFVHIPVQSGSDNVLSTMKRKYSRSHFKELCDTLKSRVDGITIATDVICGFPGESEADHEDTMSLLRDYKFPMVHISQFYPRPGTPAARMVQIPSNVKKDRSRAVTKLIESYSPYLGTEGAILKRVLVTDTAADGVRLVGHDKCYRQILVDAEFDGQPVMGRMVDVKVNAVSRWSLECTILNFTHEAIPATKHESVLEYQPGKRSRGKVTILRRRAKCPGEWADASSATKPSESFESKLFIASVLIYLFPFISISRIPLFLLAVFFSHQGLL